MDLRRSIAQARARLDPETLGRIVQTAVAAGIAWEIALQIPGHGAPFFAPIAAVIGLSADRGRRGTQALNMMTGVALGILIGAGVVAVAGVGAWQLVLGTLAALLVATAAGAPPIIRTQAAASAILVVALHTPGSNLALQRLVDAAIGGGIAIVLARFLFPVDPLDLVRHEAAALRSQLADRLDDVAAALDAHERDEAQTALVGLESLDDRRLEEALALARSVVRAAPRRRRLRRRLDALGAAWHELDRSVADARAIATGAIRLAAGGQPPPPEAAAVVRDSAAAVRETEPASARIRAERARAAARQLLEAHQSLGASVLAHGVAAIADHAVNAADARDDDRRLREEMQRGRIHLGRLRVPRSPP